METTIQNILSQNSLYYLNIENNEDITKIYNLLVHDILPQEGSKEIMDLYLTAYYLSIYFCH